MQCIRMMKPGAETIVKAAKMYVLEGNLTEEVVEQIKKYIVNPVDNREAALAKPASLAMEYQKPEKVAVLDGFVHMSDEDIEIYRQDMGLAMSHEDILFIRNHFANDVKRNPTMTELRVIDTYWSDHCRHTTFEIGRAHV